MCSLNEGWWALSPPDLAVQISTWNTVLRTFCLHRHWISTYIGTLDYMQMRKGKKKNWDITHNLGFLSEWVGGRVMQRSAVQLWLKKSQSRSCTNGYLALRTEEATCDADYITLHCATRSRKIWTLNTTYTSDCVAWQDWNTTQSCKIWDSWFSHSSWWEKKKKNHPHHTCSKAHSFNWSNNPTISTYLLTIWSMWW